MTEYRFLQPLDVLYLRGNKLFEGAGAHGASLMPPWPSLAAGALRSRMLVDGGVDLSAFARGDAKPVFGALGECLGTPSNPGSFRVVAFALAQCSGERVQPCMPLPADLVVTTESLDDASYLRPMQLAPALCGSAASPSVPVMRGAGAGKPQSGLWLNSEGWDAYVQGKPIQRGHLLTYKDLWRTDPRLGIALDNGVGTAQSGMLYTAETVAFQAEVGFVVGVMGADGHLPGAGLLRFGGDGRGVTINRCKPRLPEVDWDAIEREGRFKLLLSTPGIFRDGWCPPGTDKKFRWQGPGGAYARLVAAAVGRSEVVSGWDLANWRPKTAYRAAPVGSVYWFDGLEGGVDGLRKLADQGFWVIDDYPDAQRRAEGFNSVQIAAWPREAS